MPVYYNEIDAHAAAWLRELVRRGLIADGEVDERSIADVRPADLRGFSQCHFFAGIGAWSYALRLAGWPDDRPVFTGSCPCQPFSAAGKGEGYADERHLWPHWYRLIRECRPATVFGEQVAAAVRTGWLDDVCLSLESLGYAVGAVDFPACSVGAPHIRQRLYFVAESGCGSVRSGRSALAGTTRGVQGEGLQREWLRPDARNDRQSCAVADADGAESGCGQFGFHAQGRDGDGSAGERERQAGSVADDDGQGCDRLPPSRLHERRHGAGGDESAQGNADRAFGNDADGRGSAGELADAGQQQSGRGLFGPGEVNPAASAGPSGEPFGRGDMGDAERAGSQGFERSGDMEVHRGSRADGSTAAPGALNGFWSDAIWLPCRDGKARPTQPGVEPLAHGSPARVVRLRGYGNAIVAEQAAAFIRAYVECGA